jgi:hypothetical protein
MQFSLSLCYSCYLQTFFLAACSQTPSPSVHRLMPETKFHIHKQIAGKIIVLYIWIFFFLRFYTADEKANFWTEW